MKTAILLGAFVTIIFSSILFTPNTFAEAQVYSAETISEVKNLMHNISKIIYERNGELIYTNAHKIQICPDSLSRNDMPRTIDATFNKSSAQSVSRAFFLSKGKKINIEDVDLIYIMNNCTFQWDISE